MTIVSAGWHAQDRLDVATLSENFRNMSPKQQVQGLSFSHITHELKTTNRRVHGFAFVLALYAIAFLILAGPTQSLKHFCFDARDT